MTSILVKRQGALGDVLLTTPVVARLRAELGPDAIIHIETGCPEAYAGNPHITSSNDRVNYDRVIDLNLAYERRPRTHIVDAYFMEVFGDNDGDKSSIFPFRTPDGKDRSIVVHCPISWRNRTMSVDFWREFFLHVKGNSDLMPILIGTRKDMGYPKFFEDGDERLMDFNFETYRWQDLRGLQPLHEVTSEIAGAAVFVGSDSSMIHFAGLTDTPIVGIYTSAAARYRMPYRNGILGHGVTAFEPAIDCAGCLADEPAPVNYCGCRRGDFACLGLIDPIAVAEAAIKAAGLAHVAPQG